MKCITRHILRLLLFLLPLCLTAQENGEYTLNRYFPDGTLLKRTFHANAVKTTVKVDANGDTIRTEKLVYESRYSSYLGSFETGKSRNIYHTAQGYYDIDSGRHFWYQRDRLGSTVAVYDDRGRMLQNTAYYPSGTPCRLPNHALGTEVDSATDRLHIGNIWLSHSGMNLYDNTARLHDPILMHYGAPDPLYHNYPYNSPWSHCSGNPLNRIDPTGMTDFYNEELRQVMYRNDGHHQVLHITKSQYETLLAVNFDINTPEYQDALNRGEKKPDLNFTVENTLKGRKFIGYDGKKDGCYTRAKEQNNVATTGVTERIDTYNTEKEEFKLQEGIEYMRKQLASGKSLIAGIYYQNEASGNENKNTAHFLNIVGMGFEIVNGKPRNYFSYYDNGTSNVKWGTDIKKNRLYLDEYNGRNVLMGNTGLYILASPRTNERVKFYILSEIRRNQ